MHQNEAKKGCCEQDSNLRSYATRTLFDAGRESLVSLIISAKLPLESSPFWTGRRGGGGWGGWGRVRNGGLLEKIDNDILLTGQEQPRLKRFILISMYILHDKGPYEGKFVEKGGLRQANNTLNTPNTALIINLSPQLTNN